MTTLIIILILIICVLLVLVVLGQNSKGGGFSTNFGAGNQVMGVKKTGDILEKLTWGFAIALLVGCLGFNLVADAPEERQTAPPSLRDRQQPQPQQPQQPQQNMQQQGADQQTAPADGQEQQQQTTPETEGGEGDELFQP